MKRTKEKPCLFPVIIWSDVYKDNIVLPCLHCSSCFYNVKHYRKANSRSTFSLRRKNDEKK